MPSPSRLKGHQGDLSRRPSRLGSHSDVGPLFYPSDGLISYGPSYVELFWRSAEYVDKILRGAKPGDLPVEQPTEFELVVNLQTAKAIGLHLPANLLARADEVIE